MRIAIFATVLLCSLLPIFNTDAAGQKSAKLDPKTSRDRVARAKAPK
jgi:hypothetical protein